MQEIEEIVEDPKGTEIIEAIQKMSHDELIEDIFRHEKEVRGIDWRALAAQGEDGIAEGRRQSNAYVARMYAELGVEKENIPELQAMFAPNEAVKLMPAWGINQGEAELWKYAQGETLGQMIAFRLSVMQSLELNSSDTIFAQIGLSIGVIAWTKKAYDAYKAARLAGYTTLSSVVQGIRAVTLKATKMFILGTVIAIIVEIILYLVGKKAVVYMVLVNMTDADLKMNYLSLVNGKQLVQFIDPLVTTAQVNTVSKRVLIELPNKKWEFDYWVGLFAASKNNAALIGSLGAFSFTPTSTFTSVCVGWEIPLTSVFGGPNRCLVSTAPQSSIRDFANNTSSRGSLFSQSTNGHATVTGRMHSGQGSEGYMSVIFSLNSDHNPTE